MELSNSPNSPPGQFTPDNSPLIFKQLAPHSFIHYRAKRAAKYMNPRLGIIQIYSSFFHPLPNKLFFVLLSTSESEDRARIVQETSCLIFELTPVWGNVTFGGGEMTGDKMTMGRNDHNSLKQTQCRVYNYGLISGKCTVRTKIKLQ